MEQEYMIQQCFHCGNKGLLRIVQELDEEFGGPIYDTFGDIEKIDVVGRYNWKLLLCPVCRKPTLIQFYTEELTDFNIDEKTVLYPANSVSLEGVPEGIKSAFEAALKVRYIDKDICFFSLRRTLEAICKDQGAEGNSLFVMIKNLSEKKNLPEMYKEIGDIIRIIGNKSAHGNNTNITDYETDQLVSFLSTMLSYLYTLPAQIMGMKESMDCIKNV